MGKGVTVKGQFLNIYKKNIYRLKQQSIRDLTLRRVLIFTALVILSIIIFLSIFYIDSIYADVGLECRGISARTGPTYFYTYSRTFDMAFLRNNKNTMFVLNGEIYNPSFFPVYLRSLEYEVYLNDTYMLNDKIDGILIPPNSFVNVNRMITIYYSSLNTQQLEAVNLLQSLGKGGVVHIKLEGTLFSTCNSFTRSKSISMLTGLG
jgi:hypothetical protein